MGVILTGIIAALVIGGVAMFVAPMTADERPSWEVYSTGSARVGDPGDNLVGPNWSGEGVPAPAAES